MIKYNLDDIYPVELVWELSNQYGIDAGMALSTFILETGWGKSELFTSIHNPAGITGSNGYIAYSSREEGLEAMYALLREYVDGSISYVGKRDTIQEVREVWSEANDADKIAEIWRRIYD